MKVFSYLKNPTLDYVNEERLEGFEINKHWKHLGDWNSREYFSFDPEFVKLADQDEAFDVKIYDSKKDAEELAAVRNKLAYLQQDLQDIKSKVFAEFDMIDVLMGLASKDKYVIDKLTALHTEHEEHLKNLGF